MDSPSPHEITVLLQAAGDGDQRAASELLPLVYGELRRLAASRMAHEQLGQTLQPTALVHEAYLRLIGKEDPGWNGRGHFFGSAARAMRRILVDQARARNADKRGGGERAITLAEELQPGGGGEVDMLELDDALAKLEEVEPRMVEIVHLRYFAGLPSEAIAQALGVSKRTVERDWLSARAFLFDAMHGGAS